MTQPFFFPPPNPPALARSIETKKKETLKDPRQNPRPVQLVLRAHGTVLTFARTPWKLAEFRGTGLLPLHKPHSLT
jgi:hypothetical protein